MCHGVHIMAIGWERRIPEVMEAAGEVSFLPRLARFGLFCSFGLAPFSDLVDEGSRPLASTLLPSTSGEISML